MCAREIDSHQMREVFSRLVFHLVAEYGEAGALIRAQMLFEAFGPLRNVDPKKLFSEDADGDGWSDALASLKS